MRFSVRFAGAGGHGLITASVVVADAAARAGFHVCQSQAYGPEARGGTAHADVIVSELPILHPKIVKADLLIALTREGLNAFAARIAEGGLLLADTSVEAGGFGVRSANLPILSSASEAFGSEAYAGMLSAGAALALMGGAVVQAAGEAVAERVPAKTVATNQNALEMGRELALAALKAPPLEVYEADL
jgi:2-oxoglutarate ferredoxin oxidoreductase subunit gamma